jgi:hypothetical protein
MRTITPFAGLLLLTLSASAGAQEQAAPRTPAPADAYAYIIAPADGQHVTSPFKVVFGLHGMGVAPAGIKAPNTGHHHLLIDVATPPPVSAPLPVSEQIRHFGGGQTETTLDLPPGPHTLQLVLGDALHMQHEPPIRSAKITVVVDRK